MSELRPAKEMNYREVRDELGAVMEKARKYMQPKCHVCKVCNSATCGRIGRYRPVRSVGELPERNYEKLQQSI